MSGYTIYPTPADHINNHPYRIKLAHYASMHNNVVNGYTLPVYVTPNAHILQDGVATIANMIYYKSNSIPFEILTDEDLLQIVHNLDAHFENIKHRYKDPEHAAFLKEAIPFRVDAQKPFERAINRNPEWKKLYHGGGDGLLNMLIEINQMLGNDVDKLTGVPKPDQELVDVFTSSNSVLKEKLNSNAILPSSPANLYDV